MDDWDNDCFFNTGTPHPAEGIIWINTNPLAADGWKAYHLCADCAHEFYELMDFIPYDKKENER